MDSLAYCKSYLLRNSKVEPFRVQPVLATVTCWLNSGNPLSEEHRRESLTTQNQNRLDQKLPDPAFSSFRRFFHPFGNFCVLKPPIATKVAGVSYKLCCLVLQPLPPT